MITRPLVAAALAAWLAACGGGRDRGPAWPKPSPSETDGGESLEPRQPGSVAAAIEEAEDAPSSDVPEASEAVPSPAASPAATSDRPATDPAPDKEPDVLTTEELIIEIED